MLNIFLGYACNFKCGYCLQSPSSSPPRHNPQDVDRFVEKIIPYIQNNGIDEISYWGGEPLLYWPRIKAIHEGLLRAGLTFGFVKFVTNGSLLEDHHVEVLNRWDAYVVISHHSWQEPHSSQEPRPTLGKHSQQGESTPPDAPSWDKVARLCRSSVSFLFTHEDLFAWPWFRVLEDLEQHWGRPFFPYVHWVRATEGCAPGFYLTHDDLDIHVPHLWELAEQRLEGDRHAHFMFEGHLRDWRRDFHPDGDSKPMCHGDHHISVDLAGNRYGCHHSARVELRTGSIFAPEGPTPTTERAIAHVEKFVKSGDCMVCPIRSWCRGNCHLSNTHDVDCRLAKKKHKLLAWIDAQENGSNNRNTIKVP
ncbi:MAG: radical SAM protein [Rhodospirillaceae bacterium]|nr:radical SAM protein [Rhodospirillaceae bacterium]MBL6941212.1 radical SAM protein [Rhodospirillales bacterium]